jgi:hypothetical protein
MADVYFSNFRSAIQLGFPGHPDLEVPVIHKIMEVRRSELRKLPVFCVHC